MFQRREELWGCQADHRNAKQATVFSVELVHVRLRRPFQWDASLKACMVSDSVGEQHLPAWSLVTL